MLHDAVSNLSGHSLRFMRFLPLLLQSIEVMLNIINVVHVHVVNLGVRNSLLAKTRDSETHCISAINDAHNVRGLACGALGSASHVYSLCFIYILGPS